MHPTNPTNGFPNTVLQTRLSIKTVFPKKRLSKSSFPKTVFRYQYCKNNFPKTIFQKQYFKYNFQQNNFPKTIFQQTIFQKQFSNKQFSKHGFQKQFSPTQFPKKTIPPPQKITKNSFPATNFQRCIGSSLPEHVFLAYRGPVVTGTHAEII